MNSHYESDITYGVLRTSLYIILQRNEQIYAYFQRSPYLPIQKSIKGTTKNKQGIPYPSGTKSVRTRKKNPGAQSQAHIGGQRLCKPLAQTPHINISDTHDWARSERTCTQQKSCSIHADMHWTGVGQIIMHGII